MAASDVPDLIEISPIQSNSASRDLSRPEYTGSSSPAANLPLNPSRNGFSNAKVTDSDLDDDGEEDFEGDDEILEPDFVACFFCDISPGPPQVILDHCVGQHGCNLAEYVKTRSMPTEDIIKMVNFIRKEHPTPNCFVDDKLDPSSWSADEFMLPVCAQDHGITSLLIWDWSEENQPAEPFPAPEHRKTDLTTLLVGGDSTVQERQRDQDDARNADYFDSYSGFNIHCEMLRDKVRTESYRNAITATVRDRVVLDIGCGSGVLSCFAALAGAKNVVAVDKADIIDYAHDIARVNGLSDNIQFVHGDLDRLKLPVQQVDVIVSEWMGYFLLFEGMLDSVLAARDKYLAPTGTMIPSTTSLFLTAMSDDEDWQSTVGMWNNAYGLKFDCLRQHTLRYPSVHAVDPASVMTDAMTLRSWDLMTCVKEDLDFSTETAFTPKKSCNVTALVGFFDVGYHPIPGELKMMFRTSPADATTHWAQSVFYLDSPFPVTESVPVRVTADIRKAHQDKRGLSVIFTMASSELEWRQTYEL